MKITEYAPKKQMHKYLGVIAKQDTNGIGDNAQVYVI